MREGEGILFRGTYHELKAKEIIVTVYRTGALTDKPIGTKIVPLREVIDVMFAKADMVIHKGEGSKATADDDFDKLAQTCTVQGSVLLGSAPKWRQKGEDELVTMRSRFLCVRINEANVFSDLNDGGDAIVWIDVTWGGVTRRTREFKKANVQ